MDKTQEPFYAEIYKENAAFGSGHLDQAPAFTPTVRTPQYGHIAWRKILKTGREQRSE